MLEVSAIDTYPTNHVMQIKMDFHCFDFSTLIYILKSTSTYLIEIDHLHTDADDDSEGQKPRQPVGQLAVSLEGLLEYDSEPLACHHRERANSACHRHVDKRVLLAVVRLTVKDQYNDHDDDDKGVDDKT